MTHSQAHEAPGRVVDGALRRDWPHQIVLKANDCLGQPYRLVHEFCADLSLCPRGHSFVQDVSGWRMFCFAERTGAEKFRARLAEWFDSSRRGRGNAWLKTRPRKQKRY